MPLTASEEFREVITRTRPTRLVVMLYDEAIASLDEAIAAIRRGDIEGRCNSINLTTEIIATLHMGLDMENGGEISDSLESLYRFVLAQLIRINIRSDAIATARIIDVLTPLREAWQELDQRVVAGEAPELIEAAILTHVQGAESRIVENAAA